MNGDMTSLDITTVRSRRGALHLLGAAALALSALAGSQRASSATQATAAAGAAETAAREAIASINEALASGDTNALDAIFSATVVGHPPHRSLITGELFSHDLAGLKAGLADIRHVFPDAAITIDDLIASDDTVAARITFRGTLDAVSLGLGQGVNRRLEIGGLTYGRVADGQVAEFWVYLDPSAYLDLIGLLPAAAMATPETTGGSQ